jgi:hypothetical protein
MGGDDGRVMGSLLGLGSLSYGANGRPSPDDARDQGTTFLLTSCNDSF